VKNIVMCCRDEN